MITSKVAAHSKAAGEELLTVLVTFPRIILAELNTHRMLSKNSASSRAIPFKTMVQSVLKTPFVPLAFQKDHKGMQGKQYFDIEDTEILQGKWLKARDLAVERAIDLASGVLDKNAVFDFDDQGNLCQITDSIVGVTKQLCNRLLEPFMWHTVLVTGNIHSDCWGNFFDLRCPQYVDEAGNIFFTKERFRTNTLDPTQSWMLEDDSFEWLGINQGMAEIHMMQLAEVIYDSWKQSKPKQLQPGEWHVPFEDKIIKSMYADDLWGEPQEMEIIKVSTAIAARASYTVFGQDKEFTLERQIKLHDDMADQIPFHASPFEHCNRAMTNLETLSYIKGRGEYLGQGKYKFPESAYGWCRNFKGFIPYRELINK
jgi:hypothetical protein